MKNAPVQDNDCRTFSVPVENRFGVLVRSGRVAIARCRE